MKTNQSIVAILILNVCLISSQAQPITPAFQAPVGGPNITDFAPNDPVNLGMVFTPNANITVNALGFFDGPGVTAGESVGIYDASGNLLAQTTVSLSDTLTDSYLWHSITPIVLDSGLQYTVDAFTGNNPWAWNSVPIVNPLINYTGQTYDYTTAGLTFPQSTSGHAADAYYGPSFSIVSRTASVPDGGLTALLLGTSFAGLSCIRRKLC